MVALGEGAVSYERGTPVASQRTRAGAKGRAFFRYDVISKNYRSTPRNRGNSLIKTKKQDPENAHFVSEL